LRGDGCDNDGGGGCDDDGGGGVGNGIADPSLFTEIQNKLN